ncbi:PREDICTED: F-box/FBD/LRR-repeat protein At1g13570-like isoform X2 [Ipomoea nil]|uniref:F-box/FBD/LRR-repeat protein At1g13570-like isoform X2 n=1 Tax=Ipomoea nil TaxID=35883 RepID=UPI0009012729|nr:PREDICTED: F-box/FBD/LRR-repeat protein At1g13570-like isoform X2 [Ipomoea nil]
MAQHRLLKTAPDASKDLISELPVGVKDRILECLPTRDAARTALLSRHWNDLWLQHGRLSFDWEFLLTVQQCQDDYYGRTLVKIINNILFPRAWPVKKFTLRISYDDPQPPQSAIDRWCLFLSRNGVEELNIRLDSDEVEENSYQLPFCLLSCRTIKELIVRGPSIDLPVNGCGIFSNVTSLAFYNVEFKCSVSGIASSFSFPKLEKLAFGYCEGINKFETGQPKLEMLSVIGYMYVVDSRWLAPHLKSIKTLWLCDSSLRSMDVSVFPTAINLQVMKLYQLNFGIRKHLVIVMQLLQKCPNLCELRIIANEVEYIFGILAIIWVGRMTKKLLQGFWRIQMVALLFTS